nr:NADH dehydrogenase subunit 4L [Ceratocombus sp. HL-2012]
MSLLYYMLFMVFFSGLFVFCSFIDHLLLILLSLEFIMTSLFILLVLYLKLYNYEYFMFLVFLTFVVCEGAVGLSILVLLIRMHGSNSVKSLSVLMW